MSPQRSPIFAAVLTLSVASTITWQDSIQVNNVATGQQDRSDLAIAADDAAFAVWDDFRSGSNADIYVSRRDPLTGAWGAYEKVNDDGTNRTQWNAAIATGGGAVHPVWQDQRDGKKTPDTNIYASVRNAAGTWSANARVNDDTRGTASQSSLRIAANAAGDAIAAWEDLRSRSWNVYASRANASGAWTANLRVTDDGASRKFTPDVALTADGTAYAVWEDDRAGDSDIWLATLPAGSSSWTANVRISDDPGTAAQYAPRVDVDDNGDVTVAWLDDRALATQVRVSRLAAGATQWETSRAVSDAAAVPVTVALAVAADGNALAVWQEARGASYDVWGAAYDAASDSGRAATMISDDPGASAQLRPAVARNGGQVVVAWRDDRVSGGDIRARIGVMSE